MNRGERKRKAAQWLDEVSRQYADEIEDSIKRSRVFRNPQLITPKGRAETKVVLAPMTTGEAIQQYAGEETTVLNFASYRMPGGGFMSGALAQEEALCHESTLYPVLAAKSQYYAKNEQQLNRRLYTHAAIYSPGIRFREKKVGVITCAAPNWSSARKAGVTSETNYKVLKERVKMVVGIAADVYTKTFVIGAWGCGVFGQDPRMVAQLFFDELKELQVVDTVVIAIPPGENYDAFKDVFSKW